MIRKSKKLDHVSYDIRGPLLAEVNRLEAQGHVITKLNIGNPAPFGYEAPLDVIAELGDRLGSAHGYSDFRGLPETRELLVKHYRRRGLHNLGLDDVYTGNGVSELILLSMQALLDDGDEVLVPAPDYPLWTAAVNLSGGRSVHYLCDEQADWIPDLDDIRRKITFRTKGLVLINPNNPTGAVYPREFLEQVMALAAEHEIIVFSDEIYDTILYDGEHHHSPAALRDDVFCVTYSGLSKSHFLAGYRAGWMILSGPRRHVSDYVDGLNMLASMRLCSNVPAQYSILTVLNKNGSSSFRFPLAAMTQQRDRVYELLNSIPGISCTKPKGAFYAFPKMDLDYFGICDDRQFALDLLREKHIFIVQGTGFNWPKPDHFRIVFLLKIAELTKSLTDLGSFFASYQQSAKTPLAAEK